MARSRRGRITRAFLTLIGSLLHFLRHAVASPPAQVLAILLLFHYYLSSHSDGWRVERQRLKKYVDKIVVQPVLNHPATSFLVRSQSLDVVKNALRSRSASLHNLLYPGAPARTTSREVSGDASTPGGETTPQ
ncbi:unnamed protein product, partial [Amoebophrya sp. A25]|eukprot:GSA25T00000542001.1